MKLIYERWFILGRKLGLIQIVVSKYYEEGLYYSMISIRHFHMQVDGSFYMSSKYIKKRCVIQSRKIGLILYSETRDIKVIIKYKSESD